MDPALSTGPPADGPGARSAPAVGTTTLREQREAFEQRGFVILPGLLRPAESFGLRRVIEERLGPAAGVASIEQDPRLKYAVTENARARELLLRIMTRPQVLPLVAELHSDPFVEHAKALVKRPGGLATPWHQDAGYWHAKDPQSSMFTVWLALTRMDRAHGCMRFLEASHRGPLHPHERIAERDLAVPPALAEELLRQGTVHECELEPGDAVLFHSKLLHSAWPNKSSEPRIAFKVAFQDRTKRPGGLPSHATTLELPRLLDEVGPAETRRSFRKRAIEAARVLGPPFSTAVDAVRRLRPRKRKTFTQTFHPLRQFQLKGSDREWHQLFFYHELLARLEGVPGDVAEFGVAGGISIVCMVRLLRLLEPVKDPKQRRRVFGFDSFEGLPELAPQDAVREGNVAEMRKGGFYDPSGYGDLFAFAENPANNLRLIKGWFDETLPIFLANEPALAFGLVHVDCDLYASTKTVLDLVWDRLVVGGIVAFDELFHEDFPGETLAFREFAAQKDFSLHRSRMWPSKKFLVKRSG